MKYSVLVTCNDEFVDLFSKVFTSFESAEQYRVNISEVLKDKPSPFVVHSVTEIK